LLKGKEAEAVLEKAAVVEGEVFVVVGIPAFNEEKSIARVVIEAQKYTDKVVVCDDGSTDLTGEIAEHLGADVVRHEQNLGYGAAIQSLFKYARKLSSDVLVTLDADGQHNPGEIPLVVKPIVEGSADVVIGSRLVDKRFRSAIPWYRRAGIRVITKLVSNGSNHGVKDAQSGFRAYNRRALEELTIFENDMGASVEVLMEAGKKGLKILEVPATCNYKDVKTSTHAPLKHGVGIVMSIVKLVVEDKPLVMLGIPGILSLMIGAVFGVWMMQVYAAEHYIITNIALASIAFILMGFFALSTAITLYAISRLVRRTNNK
jgi:glycosyltransferase involved in cell wall biosynthesis